MRFVTEARVCPLTSRRRFAKRKSPNIVERRGQFIEKTKRKPDLFRGSIGEHQGFCSEGNIPSLSYLITAEPWMESATCCGMESRFSEHRIRNEGERRNTSYRLMPYADEPQFHTIRYAN